MAAAIESAKTGGKFGHMYVILTEDEYKKATTKTSATVTMLKKPDEVNPKFKTETTPISRYRVLELESETKMAMIAYLTQEEVSKEIARRMVESIDIEFIEELKNEYTGFVNETPKTFISHMEKE